MGDVMTFQGLSRFSKRPYDSLTLRQEISEATQFIDEVRSRHQKAFIRYLEGNHEFRLIRYLERQAPSLALLNRDEYRGPLTVPTLLNLEDKFIQWIPNNDYYKIGPVVFDHGDSVSGSYSGAAARKLSQRLMCSVVVGHVHRLSVNHYTTNEQTLVYAEAGSLVDINASEFNYQKYKDWHTGWLTVEIPDSDYFTPTPIITPYLVNGV